MSAISVAAPTNTAASPMPVTPRSTSNCQNSTIWLDAIPLSPASTAPPTMSTRRPYRSASRPRKGRARIAAIANTATVTPMPNSPAPSGPSMNSGTIGISIPMYTKNTSADAVTTRNGRVNSDSRSLPGLVVVDIFSILSPQRSFGRAGFPRGPMSQRRPRSARPRGPGVRIGVRGGRRRRTPTTTATTTVRRRRRAPERRRHSRAPSRS